MSIGWAPRRATAMPSTPEVQFSGVHSGVEQKNPTNLFISGSGYKSQFRPPHPVLADQAINIKDRWYKAPRTSLGQAEAISRSSILRIFPVVVIGIESMNTKRLGIL